MTHCEQHDANVPRRALSERPHNKYNITAAARDYNLSSIDVRQAYLQADVNRDLFMAPPPGV